MSTRFALACVAKRAQGRRRHVRPGLTLARGRAACGSAAPGGSLSVTSRTNASAVGRIADRARLALSAETSDV
jgi:hypothetical protein